VNSNDELLWPVSGHAQFEDRELHSLAVRARQQAFRLYASVTTSLSVNPRYGRQRNAFALTLTAVFGKTNRNAIPGHARHDALDPSRSSG